VHIRKLTGGVLLIAGTCIGAGMLALPITMGSSGFWLSSLLLIACWLVTYLCGLYVLEANMTTIEDSNYISMAKTLLGRPGEIAAWITYLLLLYSLMAAYLTGGGGIVRTAYHAATNMTLNNYLSPLPWILIAAMFIYSGTKFVDGLNRFLMLGLLITYGLLVFNAVPHANTELLQNGKTGFMLVALPVLSTAFGYHVIVPTLRTYLKSDAKKLSKIILMGSALPLVIYLIWNFIVFSTIPVTGEHSLTSIYTHGEQPIELTQTLASILHEPWLVSVTETFIFFAIASSFLGIALSLFDFLADGFHIVKNWAGKLIIALITFIPPLTYAVLVPKGFILALSYAGVFVAILHGILPALMVFNARKKQLSQLYRAPFGVPGVIVVLICSLLVIGAEVAVNFDLIRPY